MEVWVAKYIGQHSRLQLLRQLTNRIETAQRALQALPFRQPMPDDTSSAPSDHVWSQLDQVLRDDQVLVDSLNVLGQETGTREL